MHASAPAHAYHHMLTCTIVICGIAKILNILIDLHFIQDDHSVLLA